jgi:FAD/FMN-containing dehydrogenase
MRLVVADGRVLTLSAQSQPDLFKAALCSLGVLGVISTVTIQVEPDYFLAADQFTISFDQMLQHWDALIHSGQHVRFWWYPYTDRVLVWRANRSPKTVNSFISFHHP